MGREDPLEKEMATHSSIFAWRIPRTEEPGRLQSMGSQESDPTQRLTKPPPPCPGQPYNLLCKLVLFEGERKHNCYSGTPSMCLVAHIDAEAISRQHSGPRQLHSIIFLVYFFEIQLIYNVVLISAVSKVIQLYMYMYIFFFILFSIMVYHRMLHIVPCTVQQDFVVYPFSV